MGLAGMVVSAMSTVTGAILYWGFTAQSAVAAQNHGVRLSTIGIILMIAGIAGFLISTAVFAASRRRPSDPAQSVDREVVDSTGRKTVFHEERN